MAFLRFIIELTMARYTYPKIVVTGVGAVTPIGNTATEYWNSMMEGRSGAGPITKFDPTDFDTKFAHEVKNFDPQLYISRKEVQRMDLFTQYAIAAAVMATDDAGIDYEKTDRNRVGVIIGSGIGGMWTYHHQQQNLYDRGGKPDRISPFFIPMLISDIAAGQVAIRYGLKGPNYATVSACATSSHSIADALMLMQRGDADVMVVGGSEAVICPMGIGGFNSMKALSTRNDSPQTASRPFDKNRDGFVMGEGSGVLIFETLEHAMNRGATKIYAEVAGFGLTDDAYHVTQPAANGEGLARAMQLALKDAEISLNDVGYINAHGTSTPFNDKCETAAIKSVFGEWAQSIAVSSTKSMTGHLLGAAGAIESIATAMAVKNGMVPPTINYAEPDPECDLYYVPNKPEARTIKAAINNTAGFGGHNTSICFKSFEQ
ncbi:MAG TPA: beta-ketoacyl-ACP synthase II [Candidatus Kapabacteria bacterium]|jgi:3-oxoacyl-[acyl-carrier-protein] synthase II|nr:beta-ketoacyl-ACP synthase II [Candidatus Kapabacteria bacterium]HRK59158.1 beta-ketoacyl-ACP synthase II [Candidatus Kapabacteria bacterium]